MRFRILLLMLLPLLFACKSAQKTGDATDPYDVQSLNGTWLIEKEICCGRMQAVTFGGSKELTLKTKDNTYIIRDKGKVIERGTFRIDKKSQFGPVIHLGEQLPAMYMIEHGKLWLNWGYMDLHEETYTRK